MGEAERQSVYDEMRNVILELRDELCLRCKMYSECIIGEGIPCELVDRANMVLARVPRQCDVGTANDQQDRMFKHCMSHGGCSGCELGKGDSFRKCVLKWAQSPYNERKSDEG